MRRRLRSDGTVGGFSRLIPFLWPHRRALFASFGFGCIVAVLWGANLSIAFPLVKVLMEKQNLHEYVSSEIERHEQEVQFQESRIQDITGQLALYGPDGTAPPKSSPEQPTETYVELQSRQVLAARRETEASTRLWRMQWVQHYAMPWVPVDRFQSFALIALLVLAATAVKGVFIFLQDVLVGRVMQQVTLMLRKQTLRKVLNLDYPRLAEHGAPDLLSRLTFDTEQVAAGLNLVSGKMVREPLKCLACVALALWVNWRFTVMSMLFVPVLGLFFSWYGRAVKKAGRRMTERMSRLYRILEETLDGLKVVIGYGRAERHHTLFHKEYKDYLSKAMRVVRIDAIARPTTELLVMLALFAALLPAAYLVLNDKTSIWGVKLAADKFDMAQLTVLYALLAGCLDPCRKMTVIYSRLKRSASSVDRIFELLDLETRIEDPASPVPLPRLHKSIEFQNVCFSYPSKNAATHRGQVLNNLSMRVNVGEVVAIVGQNGCGKSTLLNLLPRFYDVDSGDIRLDGIGIKETSLRDLRSQFAIVTQETLLFEGTIAENIAYGVSQVTDDEVLAAATLARVLPICEKLPHGIHSRIGEKGRELSGGQRQRIALARAIVRDPAVLILDEATSAADNESADLIHQTLQEFSKGRTVLMITHSMTPRLLEFVTRIVVLDEGRVLAEGHHADLVESCPVYRRLFHANDQDDDATTSDRCRSAA
ncbi:MAG: ABC transporter ATP-binding protein [Planctomycetaceae bacterium]